MQKLLDLQRHKIQLDGKLYFGVKQYHKNMISLLINAKCISIFNSNPVKILILLLFF